MRKESLERAKKVFTTEADCLLKGLAYFDEAAFTQAVQLLKDAPRIATTGCGHSGILSQHFAHLLCCIERPARFIAPSEAVHGGTGFLMPGDTMVFASRGGKTQELIPIMKICKTKNVSTLLITENLESELAQSADVVLKQFVTTENDPENTQGTTSSVVLCSIFHALQTALLLETNFSSKQFSIIHPGGSVGDRLNSQQG